MRATRRRVLGTMLASPVLASPALAQDWPQRPPRFIVPYPPGGPTDLVGRVTAAGLQAELGQPVAVENRAGAIGSIGAGELFEQMTRTDMTHVPYRGSGPALQDLLSGTVQVMFDSLASSAAHIRAGRLRALAVTTSERLPGHPQTPTVAETVPGLRNLHLVRVVGTATPSIRHHRADAAGRGSRGGEGGNASTLHRHGGRSRRQHARGVFAFPGQ